MSATNSIVIVTDCADIAISVIRLLQELTDYDEDEDDDIVNSLIDALVRVDVVHDCY